MISSVTLVTPPKGLSQDSSKYLRVEVELHYELAPHRICSFQATLPSVSTVQVTYPLKTINGPLSNLTVEVTFDMPPYRW